MRKYIVVSLLAVLTVVPDAWGKWRVGDNYECFVLDRDKFYYCGTPKASDNNADKNECKGIQQNSGDNGYKYTYGDVETLDGQEYRCCGDMTTAGSGKWTLKSNITRPDNTTEQKDVEGGKCTYQITYDVCGVKDESAKDACTTPDPCEEGLYRRNGICTKPCPHDHGYESAVSNTCIECPTTIKGGIDNNATIKDKDNKDVANPNYGVCVKCHETAELFIYTTGECKKKSEITTQYTNAAFQKCWRCGTNADFKTCVDKFKGQNVDFSEWPSGMPPSCGDGK